MAIAYNNDPKIKQDVDSWTLKSNKLTANMGYAIQLKAANPSLTFLIIIILILSKILRGH